MNLSILEMKAYISLTKLLRYHIKYMFVGDGVRNEVEKVICKLRPALKVRLRFISHLNIEETNTVANTPSAPNTSASL